MGRPLRWIGSAVLDDGPKTVHHARVIGVSQRADSEVSLGRGQIHNEDQQAVDTTLQC